MPDDLRTKKTFQEHPIFLERPIAQIWSLEYCRGYFESGARRVNDRKIHNAVFKSTRDCTKNMHGHERILEVVIPNDEPFAYNWVEHTKTSQTEENELHHQQIEIHSVVVARTHCCYRRHRMIEKDQQSEVGVGR